MVAAGFKVFLSHLSGTIPVTITAGFDHVVEYARRNETALIIVGQGLDWATPLSELRRLHRGNPEWRLVLLADLADRETIIAGLVAGAVGILSTSVEEEELHSAMTRILAGGIYIPDTPALDEQEYLMWPHRVAASRHQPPLIRRQSERFGVIALTPREWDVLHGLARGCSNKVIAYELGISPRTVEIHRGRMMNQLGVRSVSHALRLAFAAGLGSDEARRSRH